VLLDGLKYLVVGSGIFGSVIAERIANDLKQKVLVIDKRDHVGGNSFSDCNAETGIEVHKYGSHIFHTTLPEVWEYINKFANFNSYRHKVLTKHDGKVYQMPINLDTINRYFDLSLSPKEATEFINELVASEGIVNSNNLEEKAISQVGKSLYDAFIKGYTRKQWDTCPNRLPASIITRLPVRFNYKSDYFEDPWQGIPLDGYGSLFNNLLKNKNITVKTGVDFFSIKEHIPKECKIIYTGPIDRYFNYKFGYLGWRTIDLKFEVIGVGDYQGTAVMNYADVDVPYTRIHEFRHYHPDREYPLDKTVICYEYSKPFSILDDPYYPINGIDDNNVLDLYQKESLLHTNIVFGGRLGSYKYLDMDKTISQALETYEKIIK
jgi:UDP-galactopyranose mutase